MLGTANERETRDVKCMLLFLGPTPENELDRDRQKKERICNVITRTVKQSLKFGRNVPKLLIQKTFWKLRLSFDEACIFHLIQPSHTFHLISLIHPLQKVSVFLLNVLLK